MFAVRHKPWYKKYRHNANADMLQSYKRSFIIVFTNATKQVKR